MTRQLSAARCIGHAISSVRNNIAYAFRISWPWYAVLAPVVIVMVLLSYYLTDADPQANPGINALIDLVRGLITMVAFASIAVNWHRYILLDEVPLGKDVFRLDDKTWRYFGNLLLIFLILLLISIGVGIPIGVIIALAGNTRGYIIPLVLIVLIVVPVAGIVTLRLSTRLPAIALGRRDFSLGDAWRATKNSNLPILLVFLFEVFALVVALAIISIVSFFTGLISPTLQVIITIALGVAVNWLFTIFSITILTSLYGFFVEGRDF
jgi:hypothetical protein